MKYIARRLWPESLRGQVVLLLCLGMAAFLGIDTLVLKSVQDNYSRQILYDRVRNVDSFFTIVMRRPSAERAEFAAQTTREQNLTEWNISLSVFSEPKNWRPDPDSEYTSTILARLMARMRAKKEILPFPEMMRLRIIEYPHSEATADPHVHAVLETEPRPRFPLLEVALPMDDGRWLSIMQPVGFDYSRVILIQRVQILASVLIFAGILAVLLFRVTRPLSRLGRAVDRFGREPDAAPPLSESGALEMREVTHSFNLMRQKILNNLAERDRMLVAMAHDLRTPLTRMQLRLESVEPEMLRDKLLANCSELKAIIQQSVDLARSRDASEAAVEVDINAFLESLAEDAMAAGQHIVWKGMERHDGGKSAASVFVKIRPLALKRCLVNLLDNAWRYGGGAELSASVDAESIIIDVADNGPGIGEEELKHVFEPYYRVESSRNRNTGGTGLGLTIARNMAQLNGGDLVLANRPNGGLISRLSLSRGSEQVPL